MATTAESLKSEVPISRRIALWGAALLGIFALTGLLLALNYWVAVIFFFASLLILIRFGLDEYEWRGLWLLLIICLFVFIFVGSLALLILSNDPRIPQLAQRSNMANIFLGTNLVIVFTSVLIGILAASGVIALFLSLMAIAAAGILRWHRTDQQVSFWQIFRHLLTTLLGIFHLSVIVDNFEIKGSEKDKERLEYYGGPGWLNVYPGSVVVLHKWGKITRVVGLGSTILRHEEQVRTILPIRPKGGLNEIQKVLTRDRIPLTITVLHAAQIEQAAETKARLQQAVTDGIEGAKQQLDALEKDHLIGDDYNQCYESIAKLVATKSPDIWEGSKSPVERNLRDAIMSENFEELFNLGDGDEDVAGRISRRKIEAIEKLIFEKAKQAKISDGVGLRVVDITQVRFPEQIEERIRDEITALAEARIENTKAKTKEETAEIIARVNLREANTKNVVRATEAEGERTVAEILAQARIAQARVEAQAETLRGQVIAQSFRQIVQSLREQQQSDETIQIVLQSLAAASSTVHYIRSEQITNI